MEFKFPTPDKNNQITQDDKKLFDISNKFFKRCELLDEYEVIPVDQITNKIFILDFYYKKSNLCHYFCKWSQLKKKLFHNFTLFQNKFILHLNDK